MLQPKKNAHAEVVIELGDIDILWPDPRHGIGALQGFLLMRHVPPVFSLHVLRGVRLTHAGDLDHRLTQVTCAFGGREDHANAAVADQAAIQQMEGLDNPARCLMVLDGDRVTHDRVWV
ncbi:hypothetical protein D3C72_2073890 [compost metagenome]